MNSVTLKRSGFSRFQKQHPWVFRDHMRLAKSSTVGFYDLMDEDGAWLAKGLLNPHSKIAYRVLSSDPKMRNLTTAEFVKRLLLQAIEQRKKWLEARYSCRLVHGESDHLSGLIVDAFFTDTEIILVVQSQSAGMDFILPEVLETLRDWAQEHSARLLVKNDSSKRAREGLNTEETQVILGTESQEPVVIRVGSLQHPELLVHMKVDLWSGQKTGFFLDQSFNVDVVFELGLRLKKKDLRVLDICSYVGQWSAKLSKGFCAHQKVVKAVAVDASETALSFTRENVKLNGGECETIRTDVFKNDWTVPERSFDIVVCDPPALIKNRKDLEVGKHGYLKINMLALQRVAKDGLFVTCSCSGVLNRNDFRKVLDKAAVRAGRQVLWMAEGRQSPDHPVRDWFPEGEYLKCFVARVLD